MQDHFRMLTLKIENMTFLLLQLMGCGIRGAIGASVVILVVMGQRSGPESVSDRSTRDRNASGTARKQRTAILSSAQV